MHLARYVGLVDGFILIQVCYLKYHPLKMFVNQYALFQSMSYIYLSVCVWYLSVHIVGILACLGFHHFFCLYFTRVLYICLCHVCFSALSCIFEFHSVLYVFGLFVSLCLSLSYMLVFNSLSLSCMFIFYVTFMLISHDIRKLRSITRNTGQKGAAVSRGAAMIAMTTRLQTHIYSTSEDTYFSHTISLSQNF